jgi:hypothetical protein
MRHIAPRVGDAECAVVDPPTRLLLAFTEDGEPPANARSDQLLSRSHDAPEPIGFGVQSHRLDEENPVRTPGKIDKPLWAPTFGGPAETKKARSVVASSRVPRLAGFAGSPPAAGLPGAVNWPLVQIPADRHTTTGTCVLGKLLFVRIALKRKRFFRSGGQISFEGLRDCLCERVVHPLDPKF